jgi:hypothetical protein
MQGVSCDWEKKPIARIYQSVLLPEFWYGAGIAFNPRFGRESCFETPDPIWHEVRMG